MSTSATVTEKARALAKRPLGVLLAAAPCLMLACSGKAGDHPLSVQADVTTTGDFVPGVLAREKSTGLLWYYPGNGSNGFQARRRVGQGWSGMDAIVGADDFDRDGHPDVLARVRASGDLILYPGNGAGTGFLAPKTVGTGWGGMRAILGTGDFDKDGRADVVAWRLRRSGPAAAHGRARRARRRRTTR